MELDSNINNESKEAAPEVVKSGEVTEAPKPRYEKKHYGKDNDFKGEKDSRKKFFKRKVCHFCKNDMDVLDYKDVKLLKRYVKESGKILPKRLTGTCSKHQRMVTSAIKRARNIALLPYETRY